MTNDHAWKRTEPNGVNVCAPGNDGFDVWWDELCTWTLQYWWPFDKKCIDAGDASACHGNDADAWCDES